MATDPKSDSRVSTESITTFNGPAGAAQRVNADFFEYSLELTSLDSGYQIIATIMHVRIVPWHVCRMIETDDIVYGSIYQTGRWMCETEQQSSGILLRILCNYLTKDKQARLG